MFLMKKIKFVTEIKHFQKEMKLLPIWMLSVSMLFFSGCHRRRTNTRHRLSRQKIEVHLTTSTASDKELKAQRAVDGEKPVQPLNIVIGPSKLTLWGYAQTGYTVSHISGGKTTNTGYHLASSLWQKRN